MTTQTYPAGLPQEAHIGKTALRVTHLEQITDFYRDVVGLEVLDQSDTNSVLGVGDTPLLILEGDETAPNRHSSGAGLFHNAFRVPTREALGDALIRIRDRWELDGASDHGVSEALYLSDPEGNGVEIYRDFPREEWSFSADGSVRMGTYPLDIEAVEAAGVGSSTAPVGSDVGHVHLEVTSLRSFREFYVDVVGFEVQMEMQDALFVSAGGYHHHIGANTWSHRSKPVGGRGLSWFEVVLPDAEALTVIENRITDNQYTVREMDDGFSVTGPDEIEVRFRIEM